MAQLQFKARPADPRVQAKEPERKFPRTAVEGGTGLTASGQTSGPVASDTAPLRGELDMHHLCSQWTFPI